VYAISKATLTEEEAEDEDEEDEEKEEDKLSSLSPTIRSLS